MAIAADVAFGGAHRGGRAGRVSLSRLPACHVLVLLIDFGLHQSSIPHSPLRRGSPVGTDARRRVPRLRQPSAGCPGPVCRSGGLSTPVQPHDHRRALPWDLPCRMAHLGGDAWAGASDRRCGVRRRLAARRSHRACLARCLPLRGQLSCLGGVVHCCPVGNACAESVGGRFAGGTRAGRRTVLAAASHASPSDPGDLAATELRRFCI